MALIGTHIRFALDVKNDFEVKNVDKYISGTIYPDSRYITKIDRKITHCLDVYDKNFFMENDFKKGWLVHLIYDRVQFNVFSEMFPELFKKFEDEKLIISPENWVIRTSLKILQDLDDISKSNIKNYLKNLNYIENPNNENIYLIKKYNQMFVDIYQRKEVIIQDLVNMWIKFGVKKELTDWIKEKTNELNSNKNVLEKIKLIYPATIKKYKEEKIKF